MIIHISSFTRLLISLIITIFITIFKRRAFLPKKYKTVSALTELETYCGKCKNLDLYKKLEHEINKMIYKKDIKATFNIL